MSDKVLTRIRHTLATVPDAVENPGRLHPDADVVKRLAKGLRQFFSGPMFSMTARNAPDRLLVVLTADFTWAEPGAASPDMVGMVEAPPGAPTGQLHHPDQQRLAHLLAAVTTAGCDILPVAVELRRDPDHPDVHDAETAAQVNLADCQKTVVITEYQPMAGDIRHAACRVRDGSYLDLSIPDHSRTTWREVRHCDDEVFLIGVQRVLGILVFPQGTQDQQLVELDPVGFAKDLQTLRTSDQPAAAARAGAAAGSWSAAVGWHLGHTFGVVSLAQHAEVMAASLALAGLCADAELARKYLYGMHAEGLTPQHADTFSDLVAEHGAPWGSALVKGWAAQMAQRELAIEWLVELPGVNEALTQHPVVARELVASCAHELLIRLMSIRDAWSPDDLSHRDYAEIVVAVLQAAASHADQLDEVVATLHQGKSMSVVVEALVLTAADDNLGSAPTMQRWAVAEVARLREELAKPAQDRADWSLPPVPAGRDAVLQELNVFLQDRTRQHYLCDWNPSDRWRAMKALANESLPVSVTSPTGRSAGKTQLEKTADMHTTRDATRSVLADHLSRLLKAWPSL